MYTPMYSPNELEAEVARNRGAKAVKTDFSYTLASAPDMAKLIAVVLLIGVPLVALFLA